MCERTGWIMSTSELASSTSPLHCCPQPRLVWAVNEMWGSKALASGGAQDLAELRFNSISAYLLTPNRNVPLKFT